MSVANYNKQEDKLWPARQPVKPPAFQTGSRGFESHPGHHFIFAHFSKTAYTTPPNPLMAHLLLIVI